ncbi:MAG: ATPase domain-containing protein [Candidatus Brocadiia bacterium]
MTQQSNENDRAGTGVPGLDYILRGGLPRGWTYLVQGAAGTGKTTLALNFLREAVRAGESALYVTLMQSRQELQETADSHGWDLDGIQFLELPEGVRRRAATEQTVYPPGEVELTEVTKAILDGIREHEADRLVLDSFSQLAVLAATSQQLRSPMLRVKELLRGKGCTALVICGNLELGGAQLETIVHGAIKLEMTFPGYGRHRRRLRVSKMRAMEFLGGYHDFRIRTGGLEVFPRLEPDHRGKPNEWTTIASGISEVDEMLGGGLEEGTTCLIAGTSGAGKSTLATLYAEAAAKRGDRSAIFCFDERKETFLRRAESLNMKMPDYIEQGLVDLHQIAAGEMSAGQFAHAVRRAVENDRARVVVIDSVSGYINAMLEQELLDTQLHELMAYLGDAGVLTLVLMATHAMRIEQPDPLEASYIADTVVLLRHFEAFGRMRRCIAVVKKRYGVHETAIREFHIAPGGCRVGRPLTEFSGILTGQPTFTGEPAELMERGPENGDDGGG